MKKLAIVWLAWLATAVRQKYQPRIVAVTGSVGKTTTKEMIVTVLQGSVSLRASSKNFNNEFGLPLTILDCDAPGKNIMAWLAIGWKAIGLLLIRGNYPKVLVLEMGADKPGDIDYLTRLAPPDVAVLTALGISHLENFATPADIVREKSYIFTNRRSGGVAILNSDDQAIATIIGKAKPPVITYGFGDGTDIRGEDFALVESEGVWGIRFQLHSPDDFKVPLFISGVLSREQALASLAAIAVGLQFNIPITTAAQRLRTFVAPRGRMKVLAGIHGSILVDDTYNAAPQSVRSALIVVQTMSQIKQLPLWIILGDMLELGSLEQSGHADIGRLIGQLSVERLITVGQRAATIAKSAGERGLSSDRIISFKSTAEANMYVSKHLHSAAVILVKGSQGARMEKVAKSLLQDQTKASELLVRQEAVWGK